MSTRQMSSPRELGIILPGGAWIFLVLMANFLARPVRDTVAVESGVAQRLFIGTVVVAFIFNPVVAAVLSRWRRAASIACMHGLFACILVALWSLMAFGADDGVAKWAGYAFYVWLSVFNVFAVSLFWAFMSDASTMEESKRRYAHLAVGATLGAIAGAWLADTFARHAPASIGGTRALLLGAAAALVFAVPVMRVLDRRLPARDRATVVPERALGGSPIDGAIQVVESPYLIGIACYFVLLAVLSTFMYFARLEIVEVRGADFDERTGLFATIDLWTQIAILATQLLVTARILRTLGVGVALAMLPLTAAAGLALLASVPAGALFVTYVAFEATFRAIRYAVMKPARETLFTVVPRAAKYKAKPYLDTFVYRFGDLIGAWTHLALKSVVVAAAVAVATTAIPIALGAAGLGLWLGLRQVREGKSDPVSDVVGT